MRIATLNVGTGTVKAALLDVAGQAVLARGRAQREIGAGMELSSLVEAVLVDTGALGADLDAVGHRVVHGGWTCSEPVRIDAAVEQAIADASELAPLHNPPALVGIRAVRRLLPRVPMVAVFDTAFHAGRAPESMRYALPSELTESLHLYRYGFHGIAHAALVRSLAEAEALRLDEVSAVTLQLGAGCSACAVERGRSVETSMGFTPLEGLVMATRSGDLDPGLLLHLLRAGRRPEDLGDLLARRSGLLGMAGSADMRQVLAAEAAGDQRSALAVAVFVRRIVTTLGAYLTLLEGRGAVVFGGGIGTGSAEIRARVARGLRAWNVELDLERNRSGETGRISRPESRSVYVFQTDEEREIARATVRALETGLR